MTHSTRVRQDAESLLGPLASVRCLLSAVLSTIESAWAISTRIATLVIWPVPHISLFFCSFIPSFSRVSRDVDRSSCGRTQRNRFQLGNPELVVDRDTLRPCDMRESTTVHQALLLIFISSRRFIGHDMIFSGTLDKTHIR